MASRTTWQKLQLNCSVETRWAQTTACARQIARTLSISATPLSKESAASCSALISNYPVGSAHSATPPARTHRHRSRRAQSRHGILRFVGVGLVALMVMVTTAIASYLRQVLSIHICTLEAKLTLYSAPTASSATTTSTSHSSGGVSHSSRTTNPVMEQAQRFTLGCVHGGELALCR